MYVDVCWGREVVVVVCVCVCVCAGVCAGVCVGGVVCGVGGGGGGGVCMNSRLWVVVRIHFLN